MTKNFLVDEIVTLLDFLEAQENQLNRRMKRVAGKNITLMRFSTDDFDLQSMRQLVNNVHRTILPASRKRMVKESTLVHGMFMTCETIMQTNVSLKVIPWNNTTKRSEPATSIDFGFSVAHYTWWTYDSYRRVPCILFEDGLNKTWHVLRFDDLPFDGLDY